MIVQAPSAEKDADVDYWRSRCNAIAGFRRSENERANTRIAELVSETEALKAQLAAAPAASAAPAAAAIKLTDLFSPEAIERIGEDNAADILKAAAQLYEQKQAAKAPPPPEPPKPKPAEPQPRVPTAAEQQAHQDYLDALTARLPTWMVINADKDFRAWCVRVDPVTKTKPQDRLGPADAAMNPDGVLEVFETYLATLGAAAPVAPQPPTVPSSLPAGGRPPPGEDPSRMRLLTREEIRQGYKAKTLGKMTQEQAAEFDRRAEQYYKVNGYPVRGSHGMPPAQPQA
jgi:hypothetical protein